MAVFFSLMLVFSSVQQGYGEAGAVKYYAVQIGSYEKKDIMESALKRLQGMGYRPYWKSEGGRYKMFLGNYSSKGQADGVLSGLGSKGIDGFVRERVKYVSANAKPAGAAKAQEPSADAGAGKDSKAVLQAADTAIADEPAFENNSQADAADTGLMSKNFKRQKDVTIQGVYGSDVFFFDVDKDWDIRGAYLNLVFSQSQLEPGEGQQGNDSTLTVYINKFPVYSMDLSGRDQYKEQVRVNIPADKVSPGFNEISVRTYKRIMELPCKDDLNPANWIAFHKESYVHVDFMDKKDSLDISGYPYPYLKSSDDIKPQGIIVIPDDFKRSELEAAGILSAGFGKGSRFENLNVRVYRHSQSPPVEHSNVIFIGGSANSPGEVMSLLSEQEKGSLKNSAVIKKVKSPYSGSHSMLAIISDDEASLVNAAKALTDEKLVVQMNSNVQLMGESAGAGGNEQDEYEYYRLENLGYSDVLLEGLFRQQATFGIKVPKNRKVKEGAKLDIRFRYSKVLDFEKSLMTVYLNDTPIGSKKLSGENADNDSFEVEIPKELRDVNYYEMKIAFDLNMDDVYCEIRPQTASWAFVSAQSKAYLPYEYRDYPLLEDYEAPFVKDMKFNDLVIVLPEDPTSEELGTACSIAAFLGHSVKNVDGISITTPGGFSKEDENSNLIVIGTPGRNGLVKDLNGRLNMRFDEDFKKFVSNEHVTVLEKYSENIAAIQIVDSPYRSGGKMLVLTGSSQREVVNAGRYLFDFNLVERLRGNLAIIDGKGNMQYEYVGEKAKKIMEGQQAQPAEDLGGSRPDGQGMSSQVRNFVIFTAAVLIITVMGSAFIMKRSRR